MNLEDTNKQKQILAFCYHCGNEGLMYITGETTSNWDDYDNEGEIIYWCEKRWKMLQCPACENVSLYTEYESFDTPLDTEYAYPANTFEGLYSRNRNNIHYVPRNVQDVFQTVLKTRFIDSQLCLISMRKTLELICKDQGAVGNSLGQLIDSFMITKDCLDEYKDICWTIRTYGNIAAHETSGNNHLHSSSINNLINQLYLLIEYLYIKPNIVSQLTTFAKNKKAHN